MNGETLKYCDLMDFDDKKKSYLWRRGTLWSERAALRPALVWRQILAQNERKLNFLSDELIFIQIGQEIRKL